MPLPLSGTLLGMETLVHSDIICLEVCVYFSLSFVFYFVQILRCLPVMWGCNWKCWPKFLVGFWNVPVSICFDVPLQVSWRAPITLTFLTVLLSAICTHVNLPLSTGTWPVTPFSYSTMGSSKSAQVGWSTVWLFKCYRLYYCCWCFCVFL